MTSLSLSQRVFDLFSVPGPVEEEGQDSGLVSTCQLAKVSPPKSCEEMFVLLDKLKSWVCWVHSGAMRKTCFLKTRNVVITQLSQFTTEEKNTNPESRFF